MQTLDAAKTDAPTLPASLRSAVQGACAKIAPTWPLDRFIAVNPLWGHIEQAVSAVSAQLSAASGGRLLMPRAWYREQHKHGRLQDKHLRQALVQLESSCTFEQLKAVLEEEESAPARRARLLDVADAARDLTHEVSWRDFVIHSISQFCAAFFDEGQADLGPSREGGLYASWQRQAQQDRSPGLLMRFHNYREVAAALPLDAEELIQHALADLRVTSCEQEAYLTALLLDVNGWAAWCAYQRWTARLAQQDDNTIVELLAIRLAWEWMLLRAGYPRLDAKWQIAMLAWPKAETAAAVSQEDDWALQTAMEIAYQESLCQQLPVGFDATAPIAKVQAAFCIDVRSEVFRRGLEAQDPGVQTLGFAGFFGVPIEYQPLAAETARPQLPGLLAPRMTAGDTGVPADLAQVRKQRLDVATTWKKFKSSAVSGFSFVEATGLLYAGKLLSDSFGRTRAASLPERAGLWAWEHAARKPRLKGGVDGKPLDTDSLTGLAAGILRAMSLTHNFARLVALVGHGSETTNNPHAAGLDCGACCGQTGEVNARAVAALLNQREVRLGLARQGIDVPASTHFISGLHNTTTDEVTLFDLDELPRSHRSDLAILQVWLRSAGEQARVERAAALELDHLQGGALERATVGRSQDWAQVRAEWGLANNAAFIVAPRERSQHINLQGRSFLHEYRWEEDEGFCVLELIMTAPMVVTHWINFQYYASTVDNLRYGSGNKVLHNVVGGHIGVFEGNGGDLRIGLPLQSLHDGQNWVHTPLRLSVFIEAPREAIEVVLAKHSSVRHLVENQWLYLFAMDAATKTVASYRAGKWVSNNAA